MRVFTSKQLSILSLLLLMTCSFAWAQQQSKLDIALRYIEQNREKWDLTETDIVDMVVNDQYQSKHNGVTHTYLIQRHASIEVYNAIMGVHITENGRVAHATNRFIPSLTSELLARTSYLMGCINCTFWRFSGYRCRVEEGKK